MLEVVAEQGENQEQGRGRIEETGVGLKGEKWQRAFTPPGWERSWFHTGRAGSRDLPGGTGEHSP